MMIISLLAVAVGVALCNSAEILHMQKVCQVGEQTYFPGESFKEDCNTCTCTSDGSFACTKLTCQYNESQANRKKSITEREYPNKENRRCSIEGQVFTRCGRSCPRTCRSRFEPVLCSSSCVVGCQCPPGTSLDEVQNKCVHLSLCGNH